MKNVRRISKKYYLRQVMACFLIAYMLFGIPLQMAQATPTGADVVGGSAGVTQGGNTTTVDMLSSRAVINWDSLNTMQNEVLQFIKDGGNFAVLNRVMQGDGTQFNGSLFGNQGHIVIVDPRGLVFGPSSFVQARKFTASTLDVLNEDFMDGNYKFIVGDAVGSVENYGEILTEEGAALIAQKVLNAGVIKSMNGYVIMSAGDEVYLSEEGSDVVVEVSSVSVPESSPMEGMGDVINEGTIEAPGGEVILAAGDTFSRAIDGLDSMSLAVESGTGRVGQFGTLSADAVEGDGGSITMTAGDVVALASDSVTTANAGTNGDGGDVIVYSPDTALFHPGALVEAKGGSESGDGGFFELSGLETVEAFGLVNTTASNGETGNFLIDPRNIKIVDESGNPYGGWWDDPIDTWHPSNYTSELDIDWLEYTLYWSNVTLNTGMPGSGGADGWVWFDAGRDLVSERSWAPGWQSFWPYIPAYTTSDNDLTVKAWDQIYFSSGINFTGSGNVSLYARKDITFDAGINLNSGGLDAYSYKGNIEVYDDVTAGRIFMNAGNLGASDTSSFFDATSTSGSTLRATNGDLTVRARESIDLQGDVISDMGSVELTADTDWLGKGDVETGGVVEAASHISITGRDVTLGDDVHAGGNLTIKGLEDIGYGGETVTAMGTLAADVGDVKIMVKDTWKNSGQGGELGYLSDGQIDLYDDVKAGQDLILYNNTDVLSADKTLEAGYDVILANGHPIYGGLNSALTGTTSLTIKAGHIIDAPATVISVTGSSLTMQQGLALDTADYLFGNQSNTDLTLISDDGSVTSTRDTDGGLDENAADEWASVAAQANGNITLTGDGGTITLGEVADTENSLYSENGDIYVANGNLVEDTSGATYDGTAASIVSENKIVADTGSVDVIANHELTLNGDVTSGTDMTLKSDSDYWRGEDLTVNANIEAGTTLDIDGRNVDLNGDVTAGDDTTILAHGIHNTGSLGDSSYTNEGDVKVQGEVLVTDDGTLDVTAQRDIEFSSTVQSDGDMTLAADAVDDGDGDMTAYSTLTSVNGDVEISASDNTIYLFGDVTAAEDVFLNNNTVVKAAGKTIKSENDDVILAADKTLDSDYDLTILAGDDAKLGMDDQFTPFVGSGGDVTTEDDLTITAGDDIYAHGTLTSNSGNIELTSSDTTTYLWDDVTAKYDLFMHNDTVVKSADKTLKSVKDDVQLDPGKSLVSEHDLTIEAGDDVKLGGGTSGSAGDVTAEDDLIIRADLGYGNPGNIYAHGKLTSTNGNVELSASDNTIYLFGDVFADVDDTGDIILWNNTEVADGVTLTAGDDIHVGGDDSLVVDNFPTGYADKSLTGLGDLTLESGVSGNGSGNILLGGEVTTAGELNMTAGVDGGWDQSNVKVNGPVTTTGELWVKAGDDIEFYDEVESADHIVLSAYDDVQTFNGSSITMTKPGTSIYINAGDNVIGPGERNVEITGNVDSAGGVTIHSDDNVDIDGYVESGTGYIKITADDGDGDLIGSMDIDGYVDSGAEMHLHAGDDITLNSWVKSADDMLIKGNWNADGTGDVKIYGTVESTGGNIDIHSADDTTYLYGDYVDADGSVYLHNDTEAAGDIIAGQDVTIDGTLTLFGDDGGLWGHSDQYITATSGQLYANDWVHKLSPSSGTGDLEMFGGYNVDDWPTSSVWAQDDVTVDNGELSIKGNANVQLDGSLYSTGDMQLAANQDSNLNRGDLVHYGDSIESLNGDVDMSASEGRITLDGGTASEYVKAGENILLRDQVLVQYSRKLDAGDDVVLAGGEFISANGGLTVEAGDDIILGVTDVDNHWVAPEVGSAGDVTADGDLILTAGDDIYAHGDIESTGGSVELYSSDDTTYLGGDVIAAVDITFNNNTEFDDDDNQTVNAQTGSITAKGWLWKTASGNLYLLGNNDDPEHNNGKAIDLRYAGCLPAASTSFGNLEIYAENGDIQISGDLTTFGYSDDGPDICNWYDRPTGGVSVIAENGKIYTEGTPGNSFLNIGIVGNSDDVSHRVPLNGNGDNHVDGPLGVDLPWIDEGEEGKAAIVVLSKDNLNFGPDTMLLAKGQYHAYDGESGVDDRPAVDFLATPASIGGFPRDEGDAMDVAVYTGSIGTDEGEGNVHLDGRAIDVEDGGAMIVDAYDTVTFGDFDTFDLTSFGDCEDLACFLIKLALRFHIDFEDLCAYAAEYEWPGEPTLEDLEDFFNDYFDDGDFFNIDRMEVSSRITEWLDEAVGRLPYAMDATGEAAFEAFIGGEYEFRGAGLGNGITDGSAWVLIPRNATPELASEAGQTAEEQAFGEGGCPALMQWLAGEVGVPADEIQVYLSEAYAYSTDIQPCETCARLRDASLILEDLEGNRIAALGQVINEYITAPTPPSDEQMAMIASTFAEHSGDGTYYADAGEWIDALAQYVGIMNTELGFTAAESVVFADKYITPVTETGNASLISYVEGRLSALGG